jgi:hypothetical protein
MRVNKPGKKVDEYDECKNKRENQGGLKEGKW